MSDAPPSEGPVERARKTLSNILSNIPSSPNVIKALIAALVVLCSAKISTGLIKANSIGNQPLQGKIKPITLNGDGWENNLSKDQLQQLDNGKRVLLQKRLRGDSGGRGTAVQDMNAPPATVLKAVTTFDRYAGRLAQCSYSTVYGRSQNRMKGTENIKVHMKLAGGVKTFNCYYDHTVTPKKGTVTWQLDPDKTSDFVDVQGQWYVAKHPTKQGWSRVWYSAEVALPPWLPGPIVVQLCKTSGTKALSFVKKEAEALVSSSWGMKRGGFRPRSPLRPRRFKR